MKRNYLLTGLAVIVFTACGRSPDSQNNSSESISIHTAEAIARDLSDTRTVSAPVVAYKRVYTTARTAGQVLGVYFEEGDKVHKGQVMARLDTRRQEAQLRRARAQLVDARQHYRRQKILFEQEVITPSEYETAAFLLEQAESEVEFHQVEVELGTIRASTDAVVSARLVEEGTTVNTNDRLFTIEDHSLLVVRPALSELDVARLEKGASLALSFDVLGEEKFPGSVRRIFPAADALSRLFTVEVEIHQDMIPHQIRPGYLARTHFRLDDRDHTLAVPGEALIKENGKNYVFVIQDQIAQKTEVETGVERDGYIEILSGLQAGTTIAAGNVERLEDQAQVKVTGTFRRYGFRE